MNSDPKTITARAARVSGDSLHAEMAIAVCQLRNVDPYGAIVVKGVQLTAWQAVIAENDVLAAMRGFSTIWGD